MFTFFFGLEETIMVTSLFTKRQETGAVLSTQAQEQQLHAGSTEYFEYGPTNYSAVCFFFKMADVSVQKVKELMDKKEAIEKEIKEFQDVLNSVSHYEKNCTIFMA